MLGVCTYKANSPVAIVSAALLTSRANVARLASARYQPVMVMFVRLSRDPPKLEWVTVARPPLPAMDEAELSIEKPDPDGSTLAAENTAGLVKVASAPATVPELAEVVPVPSEKLYCRSRAPCACAVMKVMASREQPNLVKQLGK